MTKGEKINVQLVATKSHGHRSNPVQTKVVENCKYYENGNLDFFTFKGGKTEYRLGGKGIYSITGPERTYEIIK